MAARSRWIVLFLLVAALVALAGCGGSSDTGSDATGAQVKGPAAESPPEPPEAEAGELEGAQRKLEANGYSVIILSEPHDLENVANGTTIVARSGISINGKGVHATEVSRIESGKRDPQVSTVQRLAEAIGVSASDLLR